MGLSRESNSAGKAEEGGYLGINASHPNLSGEFQGQGGLSICLKLQNKAPEEPQLKLPGVAPAQNVQHN